jgi:hypothetical protein
MGSGGDQRLFLASTTDGINFSPPQNRADQMSTHRPALAVLNSRLFMAWRRIENERLSWASTPDGDDWNSPAVRVEFNSSQGPALAVSPF